MPRPGVRSSSSPPINSSGRFDRKVTTPFCFYRIQVVDRRTLNASPTHYTFAHGNTLVRIYRWPSRRPTTRDRDHPLGRGYAYGSRDRLRTRDGGKGRRITNTYSCYDRDDGFRPRLHGGRHGIR